MKNDSFEAHAHFYEHLQKNTIFVENKTKITASIDVTHLHIVI